MRKKTPGSRLEILPLSFLKKAFIVLSILYSIAYFVWRGLYTVDTVEHPIYSWSYYIFDAFGFLNFLIFTAATWKIRNRISREPKRVYSVDVFIPTFNESVELLRTTISHVKRMDYPHETYLLDDGNRAEMRVLAEEMGIHYLTRTEHLHAKAGNLNNALKHTQGELIALFDADGVPRRDFLTKLVGYFDEEKVALENTVIYSTQSDGYKILTVVAIGANGIYKLEDGNYVTRDSIQKAECASSSCK